MLYKVKKTIKSSLVLFVISIYVHKFYLKIYTYTINEFVAIFKKNSKNFLPIIKNQPVPKPMDCTEKFILK